MQTITSDYNRTASDIGLTLAKKNGEKKKDKARISPEQVLKMMKEVEVRFIKPKPQPELNGALGVTLSDIAESLDIKLYGLKRKIERSGAIENLTSLNHLIKTYVSHLANGVLTESYVMDLASAQHIVSKYDNAAGWAYTDYLIRCKDALKVSLQEFQKLEAELKRSDSQLNEANKKIERMNQPKIGKTPNMATITVVPENNGQFHDEVFRLTREVIKYPNKGETKYDQAYVQKVSKINNGNIKGIKKALKNMGCDSEAINKCMSVLEEVGKDLDGLINPTDPKEYAELKKRIERELA